MPHILSVLTGLNLKIGLIYSLITKMNTNNTINRRIRISISMFFYIAIWIFLFYSVHTIEDEYKDAAFAFGTLSIAGITFLPYFITYLSLCFENEGIARKDYLISLTIVILPIIIAFIDIKTGNLE